MNIRLMLATGLVMTAFAPRLEAADNTAKKAAKETLRLAGKCAKEAVKDQRDADRDRRHARPDNKWDELCAAPPLPIPTPPPEIVPPPMPLLPPGIVPPLPPPP